MVVIACTPCLASALGPAAIGAATLVGLKGSKKKKKKKKTSKNKKGGSGYETQQEYEKMDSPNEFYESTVFNRQTSQELRNNELKRKMEIRRLKIRQEDMRKECDKLVRLLEKKGVSPRVAEDYAQKMTDHKFHCDDGYLQSCDFCKVEYLKNQRTKKKRSKTPKVPQEALPKSKSRSRSKSRPSRVTRKKKGRPDSIAMKLHAMGRTRKLKDLKKSLTKRRLPPPPIKRSRSKSKLKKTKSTGGKRSKRSKRSK